MSGSPSRPRRCGSPTVRRSPPVKRCMTFSQCCTRRTVRCVAVTDDSAERVWAALTAPSPYPGTADGRPWVALNMVVSVDGRSAINGRVGALTGPVDQVILRRLRAGADAVLVGAATVRAEGYSSLLRPEIRAERAARGEPEQPLLAIVTGSARFSPDASGLRDTASPLVLITAAECDFAACAREIRRLDPGAPAGERTFSVGPALELLASEHGIRSFICEGGP